MISVFSKRSKHWSLGIIAVQIDFKEEGDKENHNNPPNCPNNPRVCLQRQPTGFAQSAKRIRQLQKEDILYWCHGNKLLIAIQHQRTE